MSGAPVLLTDTDGRPFASAALRELGGATHALVLTWHDAVLPPRSPGASLDALRTLIATARPRPQTPCFARVVRQDSRAEPELLDARARWHSAMLEALGFEVQSDRLEFRLPLSQALSASSGWQRSAHLVWESIPTAPGERLVDAARVLKACSVGDPDTDPNEDALGFLLARRLDPALRLTPDCLQVARAEGEAAAIMAISVKPDSGWCSFYYLGVMPDFRRRGFAQEAMARGFQIMQQLGGREYHDGTAAENLPALALLDSLGALPDRSLQQWRLEH